MNDPRNITITLLCVSAVVLATLVVTMHTSEPARAAGISASAGEYIMFTGEVTATTDMLYVIDLTKKRMNAYHFDPMENIIKLQDQVDLAKAFRATGAGN